MLGDREELALGLTLMILVVIAGMEVSHLVSPFAALAVMGVACCTVLVGYAR